MPSAPAPPSRTPKACAPTQPPRRAEGLRKHEQRVLSMLAGQTQEGREERKAVEAEHGPISAVTASGTIVIQGEIRTYVTVTTRNGPQFGWYGVDEHSNIRGGRSCLPSRRP